MFSRKFVNDTQVFFWARPAWGGRYKNYGFHKAWGHSLSSEWEAWELHRLLNPLPTTFINDGRPYMCHRPMLNRWQSYGMEHVSWCPWTTVETIRWANGVNYAYRKEVA